MAGSGAESWARRNLQAVVHAISHFQGHSPGEVATECEGWQHLEGTKDRKRVQGDVECPQPTQVAHVTAMHHPLLQLVELCLAYLDLLT